MLFNLKTHTPLWTGGVLKTCDRVHETSIIGSFRWWYEAIARGLGHHSCDIIKNPCPEIKKDGNKEKRQWCDVCEIFGATGKHRIFKLIVKGDGKAVYNQKNAKDLINIKPKGRNTGWYLGAGRYSTEDKPIRIEIHNLDYNDVRLSAALFSALTLVDRWTAIGARTQHGFGVVEITDRNGKKIRFKDIDTLTTGKNNVRNLPNIKDFFFAKIQLIPKDENWKKQIDGFSNKKTKNLLSQRLKNMPKSVPSAPAVKNWLRYTLFADLKISNTNFGSISDGSIFGQIKPKSNKQAAKISVSDAYKKNDHWEFRIWGWIPDDDSVLPKKTRTIFLKNLKGALNSCPPELKDALGGCETKLTHWREFDSDRDTIGKESEINQFIRSLLY